MDANAEPTFAAAQDRLQKQYREHLKQYRSVNAVVHDLAWTLAELEQQIQGLVAEREQTLDVESLEQRINQLQQWRASLEDTVLRQMLRADELAALVERERSELDAG